MEKKESKLVSFCNSPFGALVLAGGAIIIGGLINHYLIGNKVIKEKDGERYYFIQPYDNVKYDYNLKGNK